MIQYDPERKTVFRPCGRLDKNIAQNTIILPTAAYREEGTSYHYLPDMNEIEVLTFEQNMATLFAANSRALYFKNEPFRFIFEEKPSSKQSSHVLLICWVDKILGVWYNGW